METLVKMDTNMVLGKNWKKNQSNLKTTWREMSYYLMMHIWRVIYTL